MCTDCNEITIPIGPTGATGATGPQGPPGTASSVTVKDNQGNIVASTTEIKFIDNNAIVTDLGSGKAEVSFIPVSTVWNDVQNLNYYVGGGVNLFKPQYTIEGNKITFRGLLYVPLNDSGTPITITNSNSYISIPSAVTDETNLSIITNSNTNNSTPQGRFFTPDVVSLKNLPSNATPVSRDIVFSNVEAYRRYSGVRVAVYRSVVSLRVGSLTTVFENVGNKGTGCIMVFSAYNDEYNGAGGAPLGNDPLALLISKATFGATAVHYINSTDDNPFTIPSSGDTNPFTVDAHNINSLGGFIINLEGLTGYLN